MDVRLVNGPNDGFELTGQRDSVVFVDVFQSRVFRKSFDVRYLRTDEVVDGFTLFVCKGRV